MLKNRLPSFGSEKMQINRVGMINHGMKLTELQALNILGMNLPMNLGGK